MVKAKNIEVLIYTDGGCSGNPGPGGWAYVMRHVPTGREKEGFGAEMETTNNRMELQAVIEGLLALKRPARVKVVTDSSYVKNGMESWIEGWKARNWMRKTSNGLKPVKNVDLWQKLDRVRQIHDVTFEHVKGHSGHPENERCDTLAVGAYQAMVKEFSNEE
jgi:ribonuclease HI